MRRFPIAVGVFLMSYVGLGAWADETVENLDKRLNEEVVPQVSSERLGNQSIEEFRVSDRLRSIKIDPDSGPAYYLKDKTGDGRLDDSHDSMEEDVNLRKWRLGKW